MNAKELSNYQLYSLIQNNKLDPSIRSLANTEFEDRELTLEQIREVTNQYAILFKPGSNEGLGISTKILLLIVPGFFTIKALSAGRYLAPVLFIILASIASRYLASNERKKRKDFWLYVSLGYLFWTIAFILYFKSNPLLIP